MPDPGPLLVYGPRSTAYDFGPAHPLTPLRFGPGIDLLRAVGAEPGLAPEPATDAELRTGHTAAYLAAVRAFGADPDRPAAHGIGPGDTPPFPGMHEAAAAVAGGSLRALEAILRGDAEHAHHPGGGLHHAMADRAAGFCVYDDPALAVLRARAAGLRVLYVDLDVHHGDGVEAICAADPGVLTVSLHESGRHLFPGTGFVRDAGRGAAAGTVVNLPLEPFAGDAAWLAAVRSLLPALAAAFGPDLVVSQHGADSHAWDPLAHLRVTTTAMAEAARVVDAVAHRWAGGRWLATGGGGYDAYRVVPRAWALTWLAGAHREPPAATPAAWRSRWAAAAAAFGTPGMPGTFTDPPNAGEPPALGQAAAEARSLAMLARARLVAVPRLVREAGDRGWWRPDLRWAGRPLDLGGPAPAPAVPVPACAAGRAAGTPGLLTLDRAALDRLALAPRVVAPFTPADARALLAAALAGGARAVAAEAGGAIVGLAVAAPAAAGPGAGKAAAPAEVLLAVGVAPEHRGTGLGTALLRRLTGERPPGGRLEALVTLAERDPVEPADVGERRAAARNLLAAAGFALAAPDPDVLRDDPGAVAAVLGA